VNKWIAFGLVGLLVVGASPFVAFASITYTDTAEFAAEGVLPAVGPPISFSRLNSGGVSQGNSFTNTNGFLQVGDTIRTLGAAKITEAEYGSGSTTQGILTANNKEIVVIFGIYGTQVPGVLEGLFTLGRAQAVEVAIGAFDSSDISTWGFNANVLGEWDLKPQEPILPGWPNGTPGIAAGAYPRQDLQFSSEDVNVSGVNTQIGSFSQGNFLFREDPAHDLLNSDSGQLGLAPRFFPNLKWAPDEVLIVETQQATQSIELDVSGDHATMDSIANWAFGMNFASWGSADGDDYDVVFTYNGPLVTGFDPTNPTGFDFNSRLGVGATPGLQAVPEPASIAVWGLLVGLGVVWISRRRRS